MTTVRFYTNPYETPLETRQRFKACCETYDEVLLMGNVQMEPGLSLPCKRLTIDLNNYELRFTPTDPLKLVRALSFMNYASYDITIQNGFIRGWYTYDGVLHKDDPTQHSHGIFLYSTPNATNTAALRVLTTRNLEISNFYGDGLYVSSCTLKAYNTSILNCGRNGFTAAQDADVYLLECFAKDVCSQAFDSEPKAGSCKIALSHSSFRASAPNRYALTLSGSSRTQRSNFTVDNCFVTGGVCAVWANGSIHDTSFRMYPTEPGALPGSHLALLRVYHAGDVALHHCYFNAASESIKHAVEIMGTGWEDTPSVSIDGCSLECYQKDYAVYATGATKVTMDRTEFVRYGAPENRIYVRTTIGRWENGEMVEPGHMEFSYRRSRTHKPSLNLDGNPQRNGVKPTLTATIDATIMAPILINQPYVTLLTHETTDAESRFVPPPEPLPTP